MKRIICIIGLIMFMIGYANGQDQGNIDKTIATGSTNTPFGNYRVEKSSTTVHFDGEEVFIYKIVYEKSPISVEILIDKEQNCKNYIVVSNGLSLMYSCNGKYFGVNRIDKKYIKDGYNTDEKNLSRDNYFRQKKIASGKQEDVNALTLIASYFPELIKE